MLTAVVEPATVHRLGLSLTLAGSAGTWQMVFIPKTKVIIKQALVKLAIKNPAAYDAVMMHKELGGFSKEVLRLKKDLAQDIAKIRGNTPGLTPGARPARTPARQALFARLGFSPSPTQLAEPTAEPTPARPDGYRRFRALGHRSPSSAAPPVSAVEPAARGRTPGTVRRLWLQP